MNRTLFFGVVFSLLSIAAFAQDHPPTPDFEAWARDTIKPYQKDPTLPVFNIRLLDSTTIFNTYNIPEGKPTAIVFFDPKCKHCQNSIYSMLTAMDSLKDVQFYFISAVHSMGDLRIFYNTYHIANYKNIQAFGRDYEFFFLGNYRVMSVPDVALYDEHKKLIKLIEGEFTARHIYNAIHDRK